MRDVLAALQLESWVLPALLVWPLLGALLIFMFGRTARAGQEPGFAPWRDVRVLTMIVLIGEALMALGLWAVFDPTATGWQARVDLPWIPEWGAGLSLGVDGLLVNGSASLMRGVAWAGARIQTGNVGNYAWIVAVGALVVIGAVAFR